MKKRALDCLLWAMAALALAPVVAGDYDFSTDGGKFAYTYPYYVVDVGSASNRLDEVTAVMVASAEAEPIAVSHADLLAATSGTIFKKGTGWLEIDEALANWRGQIHVLEGWLLSRCYQSLGAEVFETREGQSRAARSAGTYVHNGATLVRYNKVSGAANDKDFDGVHKDRKYIAVEGEGVDGHGALQCFDSKNQEASWPLGFDTEFLGDARVKGGKGWPLKMTWSPSPGSTFWMNGHIVTIEGTDGTSGFLQNWGTIHPGDLVATNITVLLYGSRPHFYGGSEHTLTLCAKSSLGFTGTVCGDDTTWTLIVDGASHIYANLALEDCTNKYNWAGPVNLKTDLPLYTDAAGESCITLGGYVYGPGGFPVRPRTSKGTQNLNFHLVCATNAFLGPVGLDKGGRLHLHSDGALPEASAGVAITNGAIVLHDQDYHLPPLAFHGTGVVDATVGFWTNRVCRSLTKTGDGELLLRGPLHAPKLTLGGGGVRFPSATFAGFMEGLLPGDPNAGASPLMNSSRVIGTNAVVLAANRPNSSWPKCTCLTYAGYIWNRSATNETWTFATYAGNGGYLFFDDEDRSHYASSSTLRYICGDMFANSKTGVWHTVTATPGPHYFEVRYYSALGSTGGRQGHNIKCLADPNRKGVITSAEKDWPSDKGLVWDRLGRGVANPDFFEEIADPGDGSVVTYTTNAVEEVIRQTPRFDVVEAEPGTWLDVMGRSYAVRELAGFVAVSNCTAFKVSSAWTASAEQIAVGGALAASNLVFEAGTTFAVPDLSDLHGGVYTVAAAEAPIEGMPTFVGGEGRARKWHLRKSADGMKLTFEYQAGTTILLR